MVDLMQVVRQAVSAAGSLSPTGLIDARAELAEHRLCEALRDQMDCGAEIAEAEVGAALTVGRGEAGRLIDLGTALAYRLPRVRAAMAAGLLDAYRAGLIERATRNVAQEFIAEVERLALEEDPYPQRV